MKEPILGVDIAKKKFDVALLVNDKQKHKVFTNNQEGFETLLTWLAKQGADGVHVCLEASEYWYPLLTSVVRGWVVTRQRRQRKSAEKNHHDR